MLAQQGLSISGIRVTCRVRFKVDEQYTDPELGIIDTGSAVSIIPQRIWSNLPYTPIAEDTIWGLASNPECVERAVFGEVICRLEDDKAATPDFRLRADLVYNDDIPLVLGFLDLLEQCALHIHVASSNNYLEFK